jgi:copper chaperone NosL
MSALHHGKRGNGLSLLLLVLVTGCADNANRPPSLRYGEEACDHCRMLINDDRFAAAVVMEGGATRKFDEIACLLAYQAENPGAVKRCWVCDYRSARWLDARAAFFVCSSELQTPMGGGVAAVDSAEEARDLADRLHGRVVRLDDLPSTLKSSTVKRLSEPGPSK